MNLPEHLHYSTDHEWIDLGTGRVGITAFAAEALGDIVYLQLPEPGTVLAATESCGEIESTKSVSELYAPAAGTVTGGNDAAVADPTLVNTDPYGQGWLYRLELTELPALLTAEQYRRHIA